MQKPMKNQYLTSKKQAYYIEKIYAKGGSCIVYSGYYFDSHYLKHSVLIKELYPIFCEITREVDDVLNVDANSKQEFETYREDFINAYKLQNFFNEEQDTGNATSNAYDIFSANNTEYIVMSVDNGDSLQKLLQNDALSMKDMVEILLSIAKTLKLYHGHGYLHLDLKPSNVFVLKETNQLVKLFDFDTVVAKDDLLIKKYRVSTSFGYSPHEQESFKSGKTSYDDIDIQADFYPIGIMLYEYITKTFPKLASMQKGRKVKFDDVSPVFLKLDRKILREIQALFNKTLKISKYERYKTDDELIHQLEKILELADAKRHFIISTFKKNDKFFIGRERYINEISQKIREKNCIALRGLGGIGKTSIAEKFAETYQSEYNNIVFLSYQDSMKNLIISDAQMPINALSIDSFDNDNEKYFKDKCAKLRELSDERTLFIIDTLNTIEDQSFFDFIAYINAKFILTTRCNFDFVSDKIYQIEVEKFEDAQNAYELFVHHYKFELQNEVQDDIFKIIEKIDSHTITLEILAKSLSQTDKTQAESIIHKFAQDDDFAFAKEKIVFQKDGQVINEPAEIILQKTFDVSNLTDGEKNILMHLTILPHIGVQKSDLKKWLEIETYDDINSLCNKGWVSLKDDVILMHQVVSSVMQKNLLSQVCIDNKFVLNLSEEFDKSEQTVRRRKLQEIGLYTLNYCLKNDIIKLAQDNEIFAKILNYAIEFNGRARKYAKAMEYIDKFEQVYSKNADKQKNIAIINLCYDIKNSYDFTSSLYKNLGIDEKTSIFDNLFDVDIEKMLRIGINIAMLYEMENKLKRALELYIAVVQVEEQDDLQRLQLFVKSADITEYLGHNSEAKQLLNFGLELANEVLERDAQITDYRTYQLVESIFEIELRKNYSTYDKAYKNALKSQWITPEFCVGFGKYYEESSFKKMYYFKKALKLYLEKYGDYEREDTDDVASVFYDMAEVYETYKPKKAIKYLEKCLNIRQKFLGNYHKKTMKTYEKIGNIYFELGKNEQAEIYFAKSKF
ncbi:MAG: tetratricopeptide repeat protein [Clostridia bacterium]